ncbi:MAG: hypothetical protein LAP39_13345 [Acidobacteriia bacterium]|nr:hypothetical protein [Terriglobia bacterium]
MRLHRLLAGWMMAATISAFAQTKVDLRTQSKSVDFSAASLTKPVRTGTSLPGACSAGEMFYLTNATPGYNLYYCTAANIWTPAGASAPNYSLSFAAQTSVTMTHNLGTSNVVVGCYDASNNEVSYATFTVTDLNHVTVTFFTPQTGRCVVNGFGGQAISRFATAFTSQTSVAITAATHNLGTGDLAVACYDAGSPKTRIEPDRVQIDAANNVTITFFTAQSGRCILQ